MVIVRLSIEEQSQSRDCRAIPFVVLGHDCPCQKLWEESIMSRLESMVSRMSQMSLADTVFVDGLARTVYDYLVAFDV